MFDFDVVTGSGDHAKLDEAAARRKQALPTPTPTGGNLKNHPVVEPEKPGVGNSES